MSFHRMLRPMLGLAALSLSLLTACGSDEEGGSPATVAFYVGEEVHFVVGEATSSGANLFLAAEFSGQEVETFTDISAVGLAAALEGKSFLVLPTFSQGGWELTDDAQAILAGWVDGGGTLIVTGATVSQFVGLNNTFDLALSSGDAVDGGHELERHVDWEGTQELLPTSTEVTLLSETGFPDNGQWLYGGIAELDGGGVAYIPIGDGSIYYFGWDWTDMAGGSTETCPWAAALGAVLNSVGWTFTAIG